MTVHNVPPWQESIHHKLGVSVTCFNSFVINCNKFVTNSNNNKHLFVPVHKQAPCHEGIWGNGDITPCILNFGSRTWVVSFMFWRLTPREEASVPSGQEVGWVLQLVWALWGRKKNYHSPVGNQTTVCRCPFRAIPAVCNYILIQKQNCYNIRTNTDLWTAVNAF